MDIFYIVIALIIGYALYELIFWLTHREALSNYEIELLARKRRILFLRQYFTFTSGETTVDRTFKSRMQPKGKLYKFNENLNNLPAVVAALLKGKKHEWVIIAFEKDQKIDYLWANKGMNSTSVSLSWDFNSISEFAIEHGIKTVMRFHNHPNPNPQHWDCTKPSQADINSALCFSKVLDESGLNFIDIICERGRHYQYFYKYTDLFYPEENFQNVIKAENGIDKNRNYKLHKELRKLKNIEKISVLS